MYLSIRGILNQMFHVLINDQKDYYKDNSNVHKNLFQAIADQNAEEAKMWAGVNIKLRNTD
jgi:hypothetical protein